LPVALQIVSSSDKGTPLKKILFRSTLIICLAGLAYGAFYAWRSFPLISGFGAKGLCSCMFVAGRKEPDIKKEELGDFPFTLGSFRVDKKDSSVTGKVLGFAKRKAIYRRGFGCTLVNELNEEVVRQQAGAQITQTGIPADSIPWPDGDLISDSIPVGLDLQALNRAVNIAFEERDPSKKSRTRAIVVLYNGQLVAEKYASGFDRHSRMHGWSVAKSIISALIGKLVKENKLKLSEPAPVPEWKGNDPRHAITLQQLLQQTSGLDFIEDYTGYSEVTNMLFNKGDMAAYTARLPLKYPPGFTFNYSSGNTNLLSRIIRQSLGDKAYYSFPADSLFHKIGMRSALLEPDASGTFVGSSYIFATARDYARFGLLYYNNGKWKGEQILPDNWVRETMRPAPANKMKNYGYQFWLKGYDKHQPDKINFPDAPDDLYYADGYAYQDVYIIPSRKLVVVRLGLTLDHSFDENGFLKSIITAIKE